MILSLARKSKFALFNSLIVGSFWLLTGCSQSVPEQMSYGARQDIAYAKQVVNLGPGLQEACATAGGIPALTLELNGGEKPVCQFANGRRCDVNAIQQGACL